MHIPKRFAHRGTYTPDLINLQRRFWLRAVESYQGMCSRDSPDYGEEEFCEDACLTIVDAGISVSQLLGQQVVVEEGGKTPGPKRLWGIFVRDMDLVGAGFPDDLDQRVEAFLDLYDDIRHFANVKHDVVSGLNADRICDSLTTAQDVWRVVLAVRENGGVPFSADQMPDYLSYSFDAP